MGFIICHPRIHTLDFFCDTSFLLNGTKLNNIVIFFPILVLVTVSRPIQDIDFLIIYCAMYYCSIFLVTETNKIFPNPEIFPDIYLILHGNVERETEAILEVGGAADLVADFTGRRRGVHCHRLRRAVHQCHGHI